MWDDLEEAVGEEFAALVNCFDPSLRYRVRQVRSAIKPPPPLEAVRDLERLRIWRASNEDYVRELNRIRERERYRARRDRLANDPVALEAHRAAERARQNRRNALLRELRRSKAASETDSDSSGDSGNQ